MLMLILHLLFHDCSSHIPYRNSRKRLTCKTAKQRSSSSALTAQTPSRDASEHHTASVSCATAQALEEGNA